MIHVFISFYDYFIYFYIIIIHLIYYMFICQNWNELLVVQCGDHSPTVTKCSLIDVKKKVLKIMHVHLFHSCHWKSFYYLYLSCLLNSRSPTQATWSKNERKAKVKFACYSSTIYFIPIYERFLCGVFVPNCPHIQYQLSLKSAHTDTNIL